MRVRNSHLRNASVIAVLLGIAFLTGCSASSDVTPVKQEDKPMQEHEKEFDPAKYRKPEEKEATEVKPSERADIPEETQWTERIEKTMGYRIQLYSTTSVDEAQRQITRFHDRLDSLDMQVGRLDLTFDAPYYKLRMGDFLLRPPADSVRALLHERGMTEAWVVRDRVQHKVRVKAE